MLNNSTAPQQAMEYYGSLGGYDLDYIEPPPDDLLCLICMLPAKDPVQVDCCGKIFCRCCLSENMKRSQQCPNCRHKDSKYFNDIRSDRNIKALMVRCMNMENGCSWVGEVVDAEEHTTSCLYKEIVCPNMCTNMKGKEIKILRKHLESHLKDKCQRRLTECPHCKEKNENKVIMGPHMEVCLYLKVNCPNKTCPEKVRRMDLAKHKEACMWEKVPCRFENIGCKLSMLRKDLEPHENDDDHSQLTKEALLKLQERLHSLETQMVRATSKNKGKFTFKLPSFKYHKNTSTLFFSPPFYTCEGGYKMCIRVVAYGDGQGKESHISVYAVVMKGEYDDNLEWPIQGIVTVELLNQLSDKHHHTIRFTYPDGKSDVSTQRVMTGERAKRGYGKTRFIPYTELELNQNCQHLKDDCLYFRVCVETPCPKPWLACSI